MLSHEGRLVGRGWAAAQVRVIEPVVDVARRAHAAGLPIAVASGGSAANVRGGLALTGIADLFGAVVCAEVRSASVVARFAVIRHVGML